MSAGHPYPRGIDDFARVDKQLIGSTTTVGFFVFHLPDYRDTRIGDHYLFVCDKNGTPARMAVNKVTFAHIALALERNDWKCMFRIQTSVLPTEPKFRSQLCNGGLTSFDLVATCKEFTVVKDGVLISQPNVVACWEHDCPPHPRLPWCPANPNRAHVCIVMDVAKTLDRINQWWITIQTQEGIFKVSWHREVDVPKVSDTKLLLLGSIPDRDAGLRDPTADKRLSTTSLSFFSKAPIGETLRHLLSKTDIAHAKEPKEPTVPSAVFDDDFASKFVPTTQLGKRTRPSNTGEEDHDFSE